ncbi:unnamed protein product [Cladocopium goreaui]|uniref:Uncharacterized protein n=1 Tax=Cladocopium goreaui TaxID=2562237 RepID=A0A9P1DFJ6_9DINO|nr:unnamed protein product [Cladocopium goreaui]
MASPTVANVEDGITGRRRPHPPEAVQGWAQEHCPEPAPKAVFLCPASEPASSTSARCSKDAIEAARLGQLLSWQRCQNVNIPKIKLTGDLGSRRRSCRRLCRLLALLRLCLLFEAARVRVGEAEEALQPPSESVSSEARQCSILMQVRHRTELLQAPALKEKNTQQPGLRAQFIIRKIDDAGIHCTAKGFYLHVTLSEAD